NALSASEAKIKQLMKVNSSLSEELRLMQKKVSAGSQHRATQTNGGRDTRPMSMYETGSGLKPYLPKGEAPYPEESVSTPQPLPPHVSKTSQKPSLLLLWCCSSVLLSSLSAALWTPDPHRLIRRGKLRSAEPDDEQVEPDPTLPSTEDVIRKTEQITKNIQELLRAAQENKHESFIPCSERIHVAVTEMAALFPKRPRSETVRGSLRLLTSSAFRLQCECKAAAVPEGGTMPDTQLVTQQVIQCAYDIAKAAKQLVTITTKENSI
uniref:Uncharacterized protein n=1 Tax=Paramormyrops kingsleyae TaxID=1676925 RepID=A0A3B3QWQ0_9TELE